MTQTTEDERRRLWRLIRKGGPGAKRAAEKFGKLQARMSSAAPLVDADIRVASKVRRIADGSKKFVGAPLWTMTAGDGRSWQWREPDFPGLGAFLDALISQHQYAYALAQRDVVRQKGFMHWQHSERKMGEKEKAVRAVVSQLRDADKRRINDLHGFIAKKAGCSEKHVRTVLDRIANEDTNTKS